MPTFPRIIPLSGTDLQRQFIQAHNRLLANEIHSTSDQKRVFLEGTHAVSVWHGQIADEATMLALTTVSPRSVFPMDMCYRIDRDAIWLCVDNRGETLPDWFEWKAMMSTEDEDVLDGGAASDEFADIVDGGDAGDEFIIIIDGNPYI